jgi:hypothetical protein
MRPKKKRSLDARAPASVQVQDSYRRRCRRCGKPRRHPPRHGRPAQAEDRRARRDSRARDRGAVERIDRRSRQHRLTLRLARCRRVHSGPAGRDRSVTVGGRRPGPGAGHHRSKRRPGVTAIRDSGAHDLSLICRAMSIKGSGLSTAAVPVPKWPVSPRAPHKTACSGARSAYSPRGFCGDASWLPQQWVMPRASGASSNHQLKLAQPGVGDYWIARFSRGDDDRGSGAAELGRRGA